MEHVTKFIETNSGHRLSLTDTGTGQPVLFIPGWPLAGEIFHLQLEFLANRGFRAIGLTLRGFGFSDKPETNYDFEEFVQDIEAAIDSLQLKSLVLCGFSMGGFIAAYYMATRRPGNVQKLLLISCNAPSTTIKEDYPFGITTAAFDGIISLIDQDPFSVSDVYGPLFQMDKAAMPVSIGNRINEISRKASKSAMMKSMIATRDMDLRNLLPCIRVPTAIFHAINDNVIPHEIAEQAHELIAGSTLKTFKEGGHWIFLLEQEKFNSALLDFILS
jgi:non-heme chloroperoxidase